MYMVSLILRPSILYGTGCFTASIIVKKAGGEEARFHTGEWDIDKSILLAHTPFEHIVERFVEIIKNPPISTNADIEVYVKDKEGKKWVIAKRLDRDEMIKFLDAPENLFWPIAQELKARGLW